MMEKLCVISFRLNVLDLITLFFSFIFYIMKFYVMLCFIEFHNYMLITLSANEMLQQKQMSIKRERFQLIKKLFFYKN